MMAVSGKVASELQYLCLKKKFGDAQTEAMR